MEKEKLVSLVTSAQNGDTEKLNELFNAFYNDVYYFALKTVKDENLACDITQETFVEIIKTLNNLKEPAAFVTWMKQITYHQCTRYFKKKKDIIVDETEDGNTVFDEMREENAEFIPDEALDQDDFKKTILSIIDELTEEQRSAVMMYYFDELSVKQIAKIQNVSEGTVKSRLNYARKAIKASVEDYEKKHGIKLHAIPFFPFLKWLFKKDSSRNMSSIPAEAIAESISSATGVSISVGTAGTTASIAIAGIFAKLAGLPIATKIIAGVIAALVVVSGVTTLVVNTINNNSVKKEKIAYTSAEEALKDYSLWTSNFEMSYFDSINELSADEAVRFTFSSWGTKNNQLLSENSQTVINTYCDAYFGKEYDLSNLSGTYAVSDNGNVNLKANSVAEHPEYHYEFSEVFKNSDNTYSQTVFVYKENTTDLSEDIKKSGKYVYDENENLYWILSHHGTITVKEKDGYWVIDSYTDDFAEHDHDFVTTHDKVATCTEGGIQYSACSYCHEGQEKKTDIADHKFEIAKTVKATCEKDGYNSLKCSTCNKTAKKVTDKATGHKFNVASTVKATCEKDGYDILKCSTCNSETNKVTEKAPGHKFSVTGTVKATCEKDGFNNLVCSECNTKKTEITTKAKGHSWGEWVLPRDQFGFFNRSGAQKHTCKVCKKIETEALTENSIAVIVQNTLNRIYHNEIQPYNSPEEIPTTALINAVTSNAFNTANYTETTVKHNGLDVMAGVFKRTDLVSLSMSMFNRTPDWQKINSLGFSNDVTYDAKTDTVTVLNPYSGGEPGYEIHSYTDNGDGTYTFMVPTYSNYSIILVAKKTDYGYPVISYIRK